MSQKQVPRPGLKRLVDQRSSGMESEAANIPSAGFRLCILRMHLYRLALTPSSRTLETIITNIDVAGKGNQKRLCQDQTLSLPHLHCRQSANRLWLLAVCHWAGTWGVPAESQLRSLALGFDWLMYPVMDLGFLPILQPLRYVLYCCRCLMTATACPLHWEVHRPHRSSVPLCRPLLLIQVSHVLATCVWIQMLHGSCARTFHLYLGMS